MPRMQQVVLGCAAVICIAVLLTLLTTKSPRESQSTIVVSQIQEHTTLIPKLRQSHQETTAKLMTTTQQQVCILSILLQLCALM